MNIIYLFIWHWQFFHWFLNIAYGRLTKPLVAFEKHATQFCDYSLIITQFCNAIKLVTIIKRSVPLSSQYVVMSLRKKIKNVKCSVVTNVFKKHNVNIGHIKRKYGQGRDTPQRNVFLMLSHNFSRHCWHAHVLCFHHFMQAGGGRGSIFVESTF